MPEFAGLLLLFAAILLVFLIAMTQLIFQRGRKLGMQELFAFVTILSAMLWLVLTFWRYRNG